jgi:hypothetical protein
MQFTDLIVHNDDLSAHNELVLETASEQLHTQRVRAPLPPQSGQCCYPIGEPRTPVFHYCAAPVAQRGAVYCLEHTRLCHMGQ